MLPDITKHIHVLEVINVLKNRNETLCHCSDCLAYSVIVAMQLSDSVTQQVYYWYDWSERQTLTLKTWSGFRGMCPALLHKGQEPWAGLGTTAGNEAEVWTNTLHHLYHYVQDVILSYETDRANKSITSVYWPHNRMQW